MRHYNDNGKETSVGLREESDVDYIYYELQQRRQDKSKPTRFESSEQYFDATSLNTHDTRKLNGQTYFVDNIIVASFPVQEQGGYYKLMVTPLQQYPDYPELSLDINDKLVKDKKMSFELELTYYGKDGKAQPVGLWQYPEIGTLLKGEPYTGKKRFEGVFRASRSHGLEEGYNGRMNGLAIFNPLEKGGYYHLSIRALQDYRNYPKMKLAVDIAPVVAK